MGWINRINCCLLMEVTSGGDHMQVSNSNTASLNPVYYKSALFQYFEKSAK